MSALLLLALLQAPAPTVTVTTDRTRMAVGEELVLTVTVVGAAAPPIRIELPSFPGFVVVSRAERSDLSSVVRSLTLEVRLRATRAGNVGLGPVRVVQGDAEVLADGPDVEVQESAASGLLALNPRLRTLVARAPPPRRGGAVGLAVLLSDDTVLVGQQVDVLTAAWLPRDLRARLRRQPVLQPPVIDGVWSYPQAAPPGIAASKRVGDEWYDLFVAHQVVFPLAPGAVTIPKAVLRYSVPVAVQFFSQEERFTVASEVRTLAVRALPTPAPAGFAGAVGAGLRLERSVTPTQGRAGESVVVEVRVVGEGNASLWPAPPMTWPPGLRNYAEGSIDSAAMQAGVLKGAKRFRFVFVPSEPGVVTVPEITYPWYDVTRRAYATASLPAVAVPIGEAGEATAARALPPPLLVSRGAPGVVRAARAVPSWAIALLLVLPPLAVLFERARRRWRWRRRDRRPPITDPDAELDRVLAGLVPWDEAMAPERLASALRAAGLDDGAARDVAQLREQLLRYRYGPAGTAPRPDPKAVESALRRLAGVLQGRAARAALALVLCARGLGAQGTPAESLYVRGSLRDAADSFATRLRADPRDPASWYALGATRYRQGRDGAATAAWLTALRLDPRNGTIRRALALTPPPDDASARLREVPPLRSAELLAVAIVAWWVGWVGLARRWGRRAVRWAFGAAVLLGAAGMGLRWWNGRALGLAAEDTVLRQAPHGRAPPVRSLGVGTAVFAERFDPAWVLVRTPDGARGWVARDALAAVGE